MSGSLVSSQTRAKVRAAAVPIALALGRVGLTPNALTLIGFGIALLAALAAGAQAWLLAGVLVVGGAVFDLFDGALARAQGTTSRLGAFMDSVFDRWGEGVVYVGVIAGCLAGDFDLGAVLAGAAMAAAFMVSYVRAKSESQGFTAGTGMAAVGLAPREVRIVILTVGLLVAGASGGIHVEACGNLFCLDGTWAPGNLPLAGSLATIAVLATLTTIQRITHVISQARIQDHR